MLNSEDMSLVCTVSVQWIVGKVILICILYIYFIHRLVNNT